MPLPANLLTSKRDISHHTWPVTASETHLAITHLKYGTSAGPEDITYSTLQCFHEAAPHLLPHLFTTCLKYAAHPLEWKTANCVVIPNPSKTTVMAAILQRTRVSSSDTSECGSGAETETGTVTERERQWEQEWEWERQRKRERETVMDSVRRTCRTE